MKNVVTASERITEKFGGKWERAGKKILLPPTVISSGSLLLNESLGCGGYPEGAIIEAFGPQHSGKTLMGYLAIAEAQRKHPGKENLLMDAENQFKFQANWAKTVGVNVEDLFVSPVISAEECFDKIEMAILGEVELDKDGKVKRIIKPGDFAIIMVDSVTQLTPLELIHKQMDESKRMAALAAVMSIGLKKVVSAMSLTQSKTILFFINQTRANPNTSWGANPETRTGGNSLPFYDTIAFRVSKIKNSEERDERGKIFAHQMKIKFEKNKAGSMPAEPIIIKIRHDGSGVDIGFEMFSVAEMNKLLVKFGRGKMNFVKPGTEERLDANIEDFKEDEFLTTLENNPKIKEMILRFIKDGSFYANEAAIIEDNPDVAEDTAGPVKKKEGSAPQSAVTEEIVEKIATEVAEKIKTEEAITEIVKPEEKIKRGRKKKGVE